MHSLRPLDARCLFPSTHWYQTGFSVAPKVFETTGKSAQIPEAVDAIIAHRSTAYALHLMLFETACRNAIITWNVSKAAKPEVYELRFAGSKARNVTRSGVALHDAFGHSAVDDRDRFFEQD